VEVDLIKMKLTSCVDKVSLGASEMVSMMGNVVPGHNTIQPGLTHFGGDKGNSDGSTHPTGVIQPVDSKGAFNTHFSERLKPKASALKSSKEKEMWTSLVDQ
jgi:hypothetical protein